MLEHEHVFDKQRVELSTLKGEEGVTGSLDDRLPVVKGRVQHCRHVRLAGEALDQLVKACVGFHRDRLYPRSPIDVDHTGQALGPIWEHQWCLEHVSMLFTGP